MFIHPYVPIGKHFILRGYDNCRLFFYVRCKFILKSITRSTLERKYGNKNQFSIILPICLLLCQNSFWLTLL